MKVGVPTEIKTDEYRVSLTPAGLVRIMVPRAGGEKLIARIVYEGPVRAPIREGAPVGTLRIWRDGNVVLQVPLKTAESVEKGSVTQRALDGATELMINLFRAGTEKL